MGLTQWVQVNVQRINPAEFAKDAKLFPVLEAGKTAVDKNFARQLVAVLKVAFPSLTSKQVGIVALHSVFLILRTYLSVVVAKLDGRIVRDLVNADGKGFLMGLGLWFALMVPSTYTNTMIRHLQSKLALNLRTRLTRYTHDLYLSSAPNLRYYRVQHEGGLSSVDQYIAADIASWCESLAQLYGNVMKPSLDLVIFTAQLSRGLGPWGSVLMMGNYFLTASILRAVTPAFGRLAAVEARLEGEYRAGVGRVGRESEEIAFYDGGAREQDILTRAYMRLIKHVNSIYKVSAAWSLPLSITDLSFRSGLHMNGPRTMSSSICGLRSVTVSSRYPSCSRRRAPWQVFSFRAKSRRTATLSASVQRVNFAFTGDVR